MSHWTSSSISQAYSRFRPGYDAPVFEAALRRLPRGQDGKHRSATSIVSRALDIGTGTGQAMQGLSPAFSEVIGVDPSATQVAAATPFDNVKYVVGGAESFVLPENADAEWRGTVSLVTVAQALHWFDIAKFSSHIRAFLAPDGVVSAWTYGTAALKPQSAHDALHAVDRMLLDNGFWPKERFHVDDRYRTLKTQLEANGLRCVDDVEVFQDYKLPVNAFCQYLATWSGIQRYTEKTGDTTLLPKLKEEFERAVGVDGILDIRSAFTVVSFQKKSE